jgi:GNAT superfamily N-acetyltransferase
LLEKIMPPLLIAATTPDDPGFLALRSESLAQHFNMLRRLAENWQSGKTALTRRGKTAGRLCRRAAGGVCGLNATLSARSRGPGASAIYTSATLSSAGIGQQLLVSVITHSGTWFDFLNTHAPPSAWPFYESLGFRPVYDEPRVTHRLFCSL